MATFHPAQLPSVTMAIPAPLAPAIAKLLRTVTPETAANSYDTPPTPQQLADKCDILALCLRLLAHTAGGCYLGGCVVDNTMHGTGTYPLTPHTKEQVACDMVQEMAGHLDTTQRAFMGPSVHESLSRHLALMDTAKVAENGYHATVEQAVRNRLNAAGQPVPAHLLS